MEKCIECGGNLIVGNGKMVCSECGLESDCIIFDYKPVFVEPIKPKKTVCKEFTTIQKRLNKCYNENDELIKRFIPTQTYVFKITPYIISENLQEIFKLYRTLGKKIQKMEQKTILCISYFLMSRDILFDFDAVEKIYGRNLIRDLIKYFNRNPQFAKARYLIRNADFDESIKTSAEQLLYKTKKINFGSATNRAIILTAIAIEKLGITMSAKEIYRRFGSKQCVLTSRKLLYQTLRNRLLKR